MKLLIKNGRVIDPAQNVDDVRDILIKDSRIYRVAKNCKEKADKTIDALGKIVMPGIVDMHVHLREPGREDKETIATGTRAALKGGVTSVLAMPNTYPVPDCAASVQALKKILAKDAQAHVFIAGAITAGRLGKKLIDIARLKKEGVIAITDDGSSVDDEKLLSRALTEAKEHNVLVICHSEDTALSQRGVVNRGIVATMLGLRGIPAEAEYKRIDRDIRLAEKAKARVHIAHVSCKESVHIIAAAKKRGVKVTAETAPHYFALNEQELLEYNTYMKINPPLRSQEDVAAIRDGLRSGALDVIASDHAPHTDHEKDIEFDRAECGTVGLETLLAVSLTELVHKNILTWAELVKKITSNPAGILRVDKGTLAEGAVADIAIVDPDKEWVVKKETLCSKSKNSCFLGKKLKGCVQTTICAGKIIYPFAH